jgi:hypothetical protein
MWVCGKTKMKTTKIKSIAELKKLCEQKGDENLECFIALNGGVISRKLINYDEDTKKFWILNLIDESEQELTEIEINDDSLTNIGKAIRLGSFYQEN